MLRLKRIFLMVIAFNLFTSAFADEIKNSFAPSHDVLPQVFVEGDIVVIEKQPAIDENISSLTSLTKSVFVVGGTDLQTYHYIELEMPSYITDEDGGTIRLIMQHETDAYDQVRVVDLFIGTEYINDDYGRRGRYAGRYGWTKQAGGGDFSWILGDNVAHTIVAFANWVWILDYKWLEDNTVLGGDVIRVYSNPYITTRVIFMD